MCDPVYKGALNGPTVQEAGELISPALRSIQSLSLGLGPQAEKCETLLDVTRGDRRRREKQAGPGSMRLRPDREEVLKIAELPLHRPEPYLKCRSYLGRPVIEKDLDILYHVDLM